MTLFGQDSGAVSATLLGMSPLADGLFSRIIALSGNALCGQYIQHKPREATLELARRVECSEMGMKETVDCLRKVSVEDIILKSTDMHVSTCVSHSFFFLSYPLFNLITCSRCFIVFLGGSRLWWTVSLFWPILKKC